MIRFLPKILLPLEILSLAGVLTAFTMRYLGMSGALEFLMIALSALGAVYFQRAYLPLPETDDKQLRGFFDLLATTICTKIAWIACATTLVGALFRILHLNGALEMLMIGCSALVITIAVMGVYIVIKPDRASGLWPILYRAVPVCLLGIYLFMNKPA